MIKMTKLGQIMDLLKNRELTSLEIASEINIPKSNCASYLNTLYNDGRIKSKKDKRPFKYKIAETPIESLKQMIKQLYKIMDTKMKPDKPLDENEKQVLIEIMGMI